MKLTPGQFEPLVLEEVRSYGLFHGNINKKIIWKSEKITVDIEKRGNSLLYNLFLTLV